MKQINIEKSDFYDLAVNWQSSGFRRNNVRSPPS